MNVPKNIQDGEVYRRIESSPLFQTYQKAFRDATGLPMMLQPADAGQWQPCRGRENPTSAFCRLLNGEGEVCVACAMADRCLAADATEKAQSVTCFAGLMESAVPVRLGDRTIGYLTTGHVFNSQPTKRGFKSVMRVLEEASVEMDGRETDTLEDAYFCTEIVPVERYQGAVTLLAAFAVQLAGFVNQLVLEQQEGEPAVVTRAKEYIDAHLGAKLALDGVAAEVNVSSYYFCKLFKHATGMTFTAYVNRQRIEWAKRKLQHPTARVTEVAYDVGYQSLSQFNRSFSKYVGESPTRFRERMHRQGAMLAA